MTERYVVRCHHGGTGLDMWSVFDRVHKRFAGVFTHELLAQSAAARLNATSVPETAAARGDAGAWS